MSKGPYPFKESDITRAFRAARKAGEKVQVVVDIDRRIMRIIPVTPGETDNSTADDELAQWRKRKQNAHSG